MRPEFNDGRSATASVACFGAFVAAVAVVAASDSTFFFSDFFALAI
jgi:hypothetical protein